MIRLLAAVLLCYCTLAQAGSGFNSGDGKLQASAVLNFQVVIPEVMGFNDKSAVISNAPPRDTIAKTVTVEMPDTYFAEVDGFRRVSMTFNAPPPQPTMIYTIAKP